MNGGYTNAEGWRPKLDGHSIVKVFIVGSLVTSAVSLCLIIYQFIREFNVFDFFKNIFIILFSVGIVAFDIVGRDGLVNSFYFMKAPWGRGLLYFFLGLSIWDEWNNTWLHYLSFALYMVMTFGCVVLSVIKPDATFEWS